MGCDYNREPTEDELQFEKRASEVDKLIREIPLKYLTVADMLTIANCFYGNRYGGLTSYDIERLDAILEEYNG